jgi:hypothetical protein
LPFIQNIRALEQEKVKLNTFVKVVEPHFTTQYAGAQRQHAFIDYAAAIKGLLKIKRKLGRDDEYVVGEREMLKSFLKDKANFETAHFLKENLKNLREVYRAYMMHKEQEHRVRLAKRKGREAHYRSPGFSIENARQRITEDQKLLEQLQSERNKYGRDLAVLSFNTRQIAELLDDKLKTTYIRLTQKIVDYLKMHNLWREEEQKTLAEINDPTHTSQYKYARDILNKLERKNVIQPLQSIPAMQTAFAAKAAGERRGITELFEKHQHRGETKEKPLSPAEREHYERERNKLQQMVRDKYELPETDEVVQTRLNSIQIKRDGKLSWFTREELKRDMEERRARRDADDHPDSPASSI